MRERTLPPPPPCPPPCPPADQSLGLGRVANNGSAPFPRDTKHCVLLVDNFFHTGPHGRHVCMVFETLGDNLLTVIKRYNYRGIPLPIVRELSRQMLVALDYIHRERDIIHTDLKPENVMLCRPLVARPEVDLEAVLRSARAAGGGASGSGAPSAEPSSSGNLTGGVAGAAAAAAEDEEAEGGEGSGATGGLTRNQKKKLRKKKRRQAAQQAAVGPGEEEGDEDGETGPTPSGSRADILASASDLDNTAAAPADGRRGEGPEELPPLLQPPAPV